MASQQEIQDAILNVLSDVLDSLGVQTPNEHVRIAERTDDPNLPGYEFSCFEADLTRGLGSNREVHDISHSGTGVTVTTRRRKDLTVDILAHAAGDDHRDVLKLYDAAERKFDSFTEPHGDASSLHTDVDEIEIEDNSDASNPQDAVRGDRLRISLEYYRFNEEQYDSMQHVKTDIEVTSDISSGGSDGSSSGSTTTTISSS